MTSLATLPRKLRAGRVAPPTARAATPQPLAAKFWEPRANARHAGVDLWTLLTAEELADLPRPKGSGLALTTARDYWRKIQQIYEETGHDLQQDPAPWERTEPPWNAIYTWRGPAVRAAGLKGHQQALMWLAALWGLDKATVPRFLAQRWHTDEQVSRARALGVIETRKRFFTPDDVQTLLASRPFTDNLKASHQWGDREARLDCAHKDRVFITMVFLAIYAGRRPGEWKHLRVEMYDRDQKRIMAWPQEKKAMKAVNVVIPETEVFSGDKRRWPTLEAYIADDRPDGWAPGPVWTQRDGTPYQRPELLLRDGINLVLGSDSPGPHGLRRFAATWAYYHGWTPDSVSKLLDDDWENVTGSYLDHDWLSVRDRLNQRAHDPRPRREMLRSNGNRTLYRTDAPKTASVAAFSSEKLSGSIRNAGKAPRRNRQQETRNGPLKQGERNPAEESTSAPSSFDLAGQPRHRLGGIPA